MESFLNHRPIVGVPPSLDKGPIFQPLGSVLNTPLQSDVQQRIVELPISKEVKDLCEGKSPPQVSLVMEGDKVVQVVVNCSCGQSISLACEY